MTTLASIIVEGAWTEEYIVKEIFARHWVSIRPFQENTFFGNSRCPKWFLGPWVNRNGCQKMRFSQICLLPLELDPPSPYCN